MTSLAEDTSTACTAIPATITTAQDFEITRATIDELGDKVKIFDSNDNVSLYCYTDCNIEDSFKLKQCRGVVFDKEGNLVMKAFPFTAEFTHDQTEELEQTIQDVSNCVCYDSHEGVLIRVFYHEKWYASTQRRLDAFRSKWASKESFGHSFKVALDNE